MTYYTDNNEIKEVVTRMVDVKMRDLGSMEPPLTGATVLLFDNLFPDVPVAPVSPDFILSRRPLWGGNRILELMKRNDRVYLFCGEWCCILPREKVTDDFKFVPCKDPSLDDDRICLLCPDHLNYKSRDAIQDLMEPVRFGQAMASRLKEQSYDTRLESLLTIDRGDYREMCCKMEGVVSELVHQRNAWKDRFFYKALNEDSRVLCVACKEDMRLTFYVNGDEEAALNWRPGQCSDCRHSNCKHYSWESYEDEFLVDRNIEVDEFVSSDEEEVCR